MGHSVSLKVVSILITQNTNIGRNSADKLLTHCGKNTQITDYQCKEFVHKLSTMWITFVWKTFQTLLKLVKFNILQLQKSLFRRNHMASNKLIAIEKINMKTNAFSSFSNGNLTFIPYRLATSVGTIKIIVTIVHL